MIRATAWGPMPSGKIDATRWTLFCNECGFGVVFIAGSETAEKAARAGGWKVDGSVHVCTVCQDKALLKKLETSA